MQQSLTRNEECSRKAISLFFVNPIVFIHNHHAVGRNKCLGGLVFKNQVRKLVSKSVVLPRFRMASVGDDDRDFAYGQRQHEPAESRFPDA